jgi:hypothetical protein
MAQRPPFDVSKFSAADKILAGGSLLLFIDSLFPWQKVSIFTRSAWGGDGAFAGVLMGLLALLLLAQTVAVVAGYSLPLTVPMSSIMTGLTVGTIFFGIVKFLFVVGNHVAYGAWIGLILILAVAYGGYMKMQEQKAIPPTQGFTPPSGP